jgi:predicted GIY-YIG superfamily endonuclease
MGFVYILWCTSSHGNKYYTGSTMRPLEERLREHKTKQSKWTSGFDDVKLVLAYEVPNDNTRSVEFYLKKHYRARVDLIKGKNSIRVDNFHEWLEEHEINARELGTKQMEDVERDAKT